MKYPTLFVLSALLVLTGCETLQSPQQRRQVAVRQQAAARVIDEKMHRLQGRVESAEMENARLMQELQQLRNEVRASGQQVAQLTSSMKALESNVARDMRQVVQQVKTLLSNSAAARPARPAQAAGSEHIVESGHTLSAIAQAYGTTVRAIKQANNLKSDSIRVGQKLFIPE